MDQQAFARAYRDTDASLITDTDKREFKALVDKLYWQIKRNGIAVSFVGYQPYDGLARIAEDIGQRSILRVSYLHNEPNADLMSEETNLRFRAVHDYHHYLTRGAFSFAGEMATYEYMAKLCHTDRLRSIMFSEIVLQASYAMTFGRFPKQKVVLWAA